jgi:4'-phosphopantetheinyl transferase
MILWYYNIDEFPSERINLVLASLPAKIAETIKKYRIENDRKSRLVARLLVQKYVLEKTNHWSWEDWKKDENHKPKVEGGAFFNISHSGNMVIVGFDEDDEVGVDIEEIKEIDVASMASYFHPDEIDYLNENANDKAVFYEIWTRKEAFLKASGTGIVKGLDQISVLEDLLVHQGKWNIKSINVAPDYKCAICSQGILNTPDIAHISVEGFNKFINEKIIM